MAEINLSNLARLKPATIPQINPLPEYLATDRLHLIYEDTKSVLQVPWMGVVTMAFAHYQNFYDTLWGGLRDLAGSAEFIAACRALRSHTEQQATSFGSARISDDLKSMGYSDREIDDVREQIEIFSHGNMPYVLIATAARLLLEDFSLSSTKLCTPFKGRHGPTTSNHLTLIEAHHADAPTLSVYEDIKATLGLPFVNTDYRALARWPSYFQLAWSNAKPHIQTAAYEDAVTSIHDVAVKQVLSLPNPAGLSAKSLKAAAAKDAPIEEIREVVRLFQWLLPGLVTNIALMQHQLRL
ncbi:halocarboxylic acid dehydrogenase DehI family protein [Sneathiella marina]|uniref:Halocarboxylic acid dehydrogenase DehI family protein n=1 Tax=Sneathiella marina TaxID=2950108 RepID=A0ABY4W036_9PROT|nr:halocarboxylic acid dehydrogenase DehI family protein [Sneathiella marina]USG60545.1 halocarboxylic acid dehydrogenase DehI family protein [Sneathiella marina]